MIFSFDNYIHRPLISLYVSLCCFIVHGICASTKFPYYLKFLPSPHFSSNSLPVSSRYLGSMVSLELGFSRSSFFFFFFSFYPQGNFEC